MTVYPIMLVVGILVLGWGAVTGTSAPTATGALLIGASVLPSLWRRRDRPESGGHDRDNA